MRRAIRLAGLQTSVAASCKMHDEAAEAIAICTIRTADACTVGGLQTTQSPNCLRLR